MLTVMIQIVMDFNNPKQGFIMHSGIGTDSSPWGLSVVGNWGQDDGVVK